MVCTERQRSGLLTLAVCAWQSLRDERELFSARTSRTAFRKFSQSAPSRHLWSRLGRIAESPQASEKLMASFRDAAAVVTVMAAELERTHLASVMEAANANSEMQSKLEVLLPQQSGRPNSARPRSRHARPSSTQPAPLDMPLIPENAPEAAPGLFTPSNVPGFTGAKTPTTPSTRSRPMSATDSARAGLSLIMGDDGTKPAPRQARSAGASRSLSIDVTEQQDR